MNDEFWRGRFLEDRVSADDAFLMECLWQKETGLPMRVWSSGLPTFDIPILRVQTSHVEESDLGQCFGVSITRVPKVVCKTNLVVTEIGVNLAGKSNVPIPLTSPLRRDDWLSMEDFVLATSFIRKNKAALLEHWDGITSTSGFLRKLTRL